MLGYLRENTGNWIIKFFLGIIVIVFIFLGVGSFGSKRHDTIAMVNDEPITINEYQQAYKMMVDQMRARFGKNFNDDILKALNVKQQALDSLIEQKLILAQADKLKINISDKELQQSLLSIKAFQRNGQFNLGQYKRVLSLNALTPEIFEQNQINSLRQQKVRNMVLSTVNVSDLEAANWYLFQNTKIKLDYLLFSPNDYSDIHPEKEMVKKFYDENKDSYKSEPRIKALYIKFSPADYKGEVNIIEDNIKEYYEQHIEEFKTPEKIEARHILIKVDKNADKKTIDAALKKALKIYKMAEKGDDFQKLAKKYSEGPSKKSGGYLGIFDKQSMIKPFADKAFAMKAGEISKPVRTQFGWHIIKVVAKFDAATKPLARASEKIKNILENQELQNFAYDRAGEAFDAVIDGDDFEQVAMIANKKIIKTKEFTQNGKGLDLPESNAFASAAFKLPIDDISDVQQLGDSYYLIRVIKRIEPVVQAFDLVKKRVIKELTQKLQKEKARKEAEIALKKALDFKSLEKLAKVYPLKFHTTKEFKRNGIVEGVADSSEFIQAGFTLTQKNKIYHDIVKTKSGYYVIGFKEKKIPDTSEISENLKKIKNEITWKKQSQSFQAWIAQLRKINKINYDPQVLN